MYISSSDNKQLRYVDSIYILKCLFTTVVCRLIYLFEHVWNILREFKDGSIRIRQKFFSGLKYKKKVFPASRVGFFFRHPLFRKQRYNFVWPDRYIDTWYIGTGLFKHLLLRLACCRWIIHNFSVKHNLHMFCLVLPQTLLNIYII